MKASLQVNSSQAVNLDRSKKRKFSQAKREWVVSDDSEQLDDMQTKKKKLKTQIFEVIRCRDTTYSIKHDQVPQAQQETSSFLESNENYFELGVNRDQYE